MGPLLREGGAGAATADAVVAIGVRLELRRDEVADRIVARIGEDIADYRLADEALLRGDVRSITLQHLDLMLRALLEGRAATEADFAATRAGGARRVHQGISLESFQRAARLWGRLIWEAVLEESDAGVPAEREAALLIAGRVMEHVDLMSTNVAQGFLNELQSVWSDREVVRRDLLDGLVSGQGDSEHPPAGPLAQAAARRPLRRRGAPRPGRARRRAARLLLSLGLKLCELRVKP